MYFTNNTICRPNFIKSYFTIYYRHFKNYLSILMARLLLTFAIPSSLVLFVSLDLNLNNSESIMFLFGSSLQYCNKPADSFSYLSHIFKLALQYQDRHDYLYTSIIYFTYAASEWCTTFKDYLFIISICSFCCYVCTLPNDCYDSL